MSKVVYGSISFWSPQSHLRLAIEKLVLNKKLILTMSSYKTTISQDLLECNVCYQIPSKDSLRLCVNNHITCRNCIKKSNLVNCQLCNQGFSIVRNQLLEQILDSVRNEPRIVLGVNCTFKPAGCEELVTKSQPQRTWITLLFSKNWLFQLQLSSWQNSNFIVFVRTTLQKFPHQ